MRPKIKQKIIKMFTANEFIDLPKPAKSFIPDWYKKIPSFSNGDNSPKITSSNSTNVTVKGCMPFLDTFLTGYMATLWQDIEVTIENNQPNIKWRTSPPVVASRGPNPHSTFPVPTGCVNNEFTWINPFIFETPPGYDLLIIHPLNRYDLPFVTLSGISSGELFGTGSIPFYIKEGFSGIIEKGTPLFQVIPVKREPWKSRVEPKIFQKDEKAKHDSLSQISGWYKEHLRKPKNYR
jgi:hypothetical protein